MNNLKRLLKEDFNSDQQDLIDKLAFVINPFLEQVSAAFNKNITIDNLSREIVTVDVQNTSGNLTIPVQFKTSLTSKVVGINVVKAENLTNSSTYPTNAPWISWTASTTSSKIFNLNKVTGIQDGDKYRLTLELIS